MSDHQRCEERIRILETEQRASAARAIENARRFADDLATERRVGALRVEVIKREACEKLLAMGDALREARAEVARLREMARVVGVGPAL